MIVSDNLYSSVHSFITPDFITQMGRFIGESTERTTRGAKSVFTTILLGVVNKGSTTDGAKSLIELTRTQGIDPDEGIQINEVQLKRGTETVEGIFGQGLGTVISRLQESTGLNALCISKMLGVVTPLVVGIVGTKIRQDSMSATTLSNFLTYQRQALLSFLPGQVFDLRKKVKRNWKVIATVAVLAVILGLWILTKVADRSIATTEQQPRPIPQRVEQVVPMSNLAPITQLKEFLEDGDESELPKRFSIGGIRFAEGTSELLKGSEKELNLLAKVLLDNPYARTRLEGFTDNSGEPLRLQQLSGQRVLTIKNQLVSRGVEASQIETAGLGPSDRIASNSDAAGRARNNRVEFIVLEK